MNAAIPSTNSGGASNSVQQTGDRQHHTAQQVIAENVKFLIEQLEQGKSEMLTAYLVAMARFHNYSFGNILSIARYRPDATHVAGIRTLSRVAQYFIPNVDRAKKTVQELKTVAPLLSMIPITVVDRTGRPVAKVGANDDGTEGRLFQQLEHFHS